MQISRIRLSDKTSRLHPRHVVPKPAQAYEPEVPVKVREWISPALASPDLVLEAQQRQFSALLTGATLSMMLIIGVASASTTISTNISTGGTLSVTGQSVLTGGLSARVRSCRRGNEL